MYVYKTMMKTDCYLVRRISVVSYPVARIVDRLAKPCLNLERLDAEIAFRRPVFSGPPPDPIEHTPVKAFEKTIPENEVAAVKRPTVGRGDVLLLKLIQLAASSNVRGNEAFALVGRRRRAMIISIEGADHLPPQRRAGPRNNSSISCRRSRRAAFFSCTVCF